MKKKLDQLHKESVEVELTADERQQLRESLLTYIQSHPHGPPEVSPFPHKKGKRLLAVAVIVLALIAGASVSYAASGALPGTFFYPVRTRVNERLMELIAFSPGRRASLEATLALRRLQEAEDLEKQAKLTPSLQTQIDTHFKYHLLAYEINLNMVKGRSGPHKADTITTSFASSLLTHTRILATLSLIHPTSNGTYIGDALQTSSSLFIPAVISASTTDNL